MRSTQWPPGGHVVATRSGNPGVGDDKGRFAPGARRMVVEFAGGDLDGLDSAQPVKAEVSADNGKVESLTVERNPSLNLWQVAFVVTPRHAMKPIDM